MPLPLLIGLGLATNMTTQSEDHQAKANGPQTGTTESLSEGKPSPDEERTDLPTEQE